MNNKAQYYLIGLFISLVNFSCETPSQESKTTPSVLTTDQVEVKASIEKLFQTMYDGDSATARLLFKDSTRLYTIFSTDDSTIIKEGKLQQLIHAIGSLHDVKWIEKSWDYRINIDGHFAQAWCSYAFFAGERFSHCGTDAFHLVKQEGVWLIFSLTDTRRKEDCLFPKGDFSEPKDLER